MPWLHICKQNFAQLSRHTCITLEEAGSSVSIIIIFRYIVMYQLVAQCRWFSPVFIGVRVARSLVFCLEFCKSLFCSFSFAHCVVCPSSISGVWLPFCHLQTLLKIYCAISMVISFQFSLTNISNHNDITEVLLTVVFIPIILKSSYFLKHYCRNKNVDFKYNAHEAFLE